MFNKVAIPLVSAVLFVGAVVAPTTASASSGAHAPVAHSAKKRCKKGFKRKHRHGRVVCVRKKHWPNAPGRGAAPAPAPAPTGQAPTLPDTSGGTPVGSPPPPNSGPAPVPPGPPSPHGAAASGKKASASAVWNLVAVSDWQPPTEPIYGANAYWFIAEYEDEVGDIAYVFFYYGYDEAGALGTWAYYAV